MLPKTAKTCIIFIWLKLIGVSKSKIQQRLSVQGFQTPIIIQWSQCNKYIEFPNNKQQHTVRLGMEGQNTAECWGSQTSVIIRGNNPCAGELPPPQHQMSNYKAGASYDAAVYMNLHMVKLSHTSKHILMAEFYFNVFVWIHSRGWGAIHSSQVS